MEIKTKYNIGDKLYYVNDDNQIDTLIVNEIHIQRGDIWYCDIRDNIVREYLLFSNENDLRTNYKSNLCNLLKSIEDDVDLLDNIKVIIKCCKLLDTKRLTIDFNGDKLTTTLTIE